MDNTLSFVKHTKNVIKTASQKLYLLNKLRPYLSNLACLQVYKSMVLPYIEYGDVLYSCTNVELLNKLQRIQNSGLKLSFRLPQTAGTLDIHRKAKLNLLIDRRDSHLLNLMFHRRNDPDYVDNREIHTRLHDYKTLVVQRPKNVFFHQKRLFQRREPLEQP